MSRITKLQPIFKSLYLKYVDKNPYDNTHIKQHKNISQPTAHHHIGLVSYTY